MQQPIGIFDSGFGGLTVLRDIVKKLPQYDYLYLGDSARSPYGTRSFETVYAYTLECVQKLFDQGCSLVVLACNTASAKALRTIQQNDLPRIAPHKRVLGVIRPTTEIVGNYSKTGHIGIMATNGTVASNSYVIEIARFFPEVKVIQQACPMWVPLIENKEYDSQGADYFIKKYCEELLSRDAKIDVIVLACTHYPIIAAKIAAHLPPHIRLIAQGPVVADGLANYLSRHPEIDNVCSKGGKIKFLTTDLPETFNDAATLFLGKKVNSEHLTI